MANSYHNPIRCICIYIQACAVSSKLAMTNTRLIQPGGGFLKRYLHSEWFSVTGLKGNRETSCKQLHLSYRQSGAGGGETKEQKERLSGCADSEIAGGLDAWQPGPRLPRVPGAAECTECAAPPGLPALPTLRVPTLLVFHPSAGPLPGTQRGDTGDVFPPLCSPNTRPHHRGFLCILGFICQLGTLGVFAMSHWEGC